jgi:hypothetical protein
MEAGQKMYTVISLNKKKTILRYVQLTRCQFGKYFSKDVINFLLQNSRIPKIEKIGKTKIVKFTIDSTECLVVDLFCSAFTNRFSGRNFKVITTKYIGPSYGSTGNVSVIEQQPEKVDSKLIPEHVTEPKPQSEKTSTGCMTNKKTKTKVIPFKNYYVFNYDYSMVIQSNRRNLSTFYIFSDVG